MSAPRENLQEALCSYSTDTLRYIDTVKGFCERFSTWKDTREKELINIKDIKDRADKIDLSFWHGMRAENKCRAVREYMKSKLTFKSANSRRKKLKKKLDAVLEDTLRGLEELHSFLDAVEKLAVTSLHVFTGENQVLHLPEGISPEQVQNLIIAARLICPLLLKFKRDAKVFFLPKLQNVEVLAYQLDKYIQTAQKICEEFEKCSLSDISLNMNGDIVVDLSVDFSEDDIQNMLCHINQLHEIRMDQDFRMVFLFQEDSCSDFINKFNECRPRMQQFLSELEECAVQLDRMNKGAKISSVAGSSVGVIGSALFIAALALGPVTAGVPLGLTIGGTAVGIVSGVIDVVTSAIERRANSTQQNKANQIFENFMDDVKSLHGCMAEVASQPVTNIKEKPLDEILAKCEVIFKFCRTGYALYSLYEQVSRFNTSNVQAQEAEALQTLPGLAPSTQDISPTLCEGCLPKVVRVGSIIFNVLLLGCSLYTIFNDSISLAKGSETKISKLIRTRSALLCSEIDSWQKIHNSLSKGLQTSEEQKSVLEKQFYS